MTRIEDKLICLSLNKVWQPISQKTVRDAICSLSKGEFLALDIDYESNGSDIDFSKPIKMNPVDWIDWTNLSVRNFDFAIRSPRLTIRVPTVIISKNYSKIPMRRMRLSIESIRRRDKDICQYSGVKLTEEQGSVDHIIPKSSGGEDSWENLVFCDKKINLRKGSKSLKEVGLTLLKQPIEPPVCPYSISAKESNHRDWAYFLS